MNMALPHSQTMLATPRLPTSRSLMEQALAPFMLLGMPHLTPFGLSDTWLMKELGHRHWLMLALRLGMEDADFRTPDGREAYASICAISLEESDDGLNSARANDILEISSSLSMLQGQRHSSHHFMTIAGRPICTVELVSIFVARQSEADNHTLARVEQQEPLAFKAGRSELATRASAMRKDTAARQGEESSDYSLRLRFSPLPREDFNGAGLLYFANFRSFFTRAVAQSGIEPERFKRTETFFFGNIRAGEDILVGIRGPCDDHSVSADVLRDDGKIIAVARWLESRAST